MYVFDADDAEGRMTSDATISAMFCRRCGYNLRGLPENRCAESGRTFDPKDRKSYSTHSGSPSRRDWARRIVVSLIALTLLAGTGAFSVWWPWHRDGAAIRMVPRCGGTVDTTTVGPKWLQDLLGQRGGFLLERAGPACSLACSTVADADLSAFEDLNCRSLILPWWLVAACFAFLPSRWVYHWWRQKVVRARIDEARCPDCGYDMRATPGRCPECGAAPKPAHDRAAAPSQSVGAGGVP